MLVRTQRPHALSVKYKDVQEAAQSMKLTLHAFEANSPTAIDAAFGKMASDHDAQALMMLADSYLNNRVKELADLLKNRLPAIYGFREFADAGGLLSYGFEPQLAQPACSFICGQDF